MAPKSWLGQIVGIMCAVCGLLMVALPVSVVATNFSIYYSYAKARISLPPKMKVKLAEHANSFMGQHTVKDEKTYNKRNKVSPEKTLTNGNIENGHRRNSSTGSKKLRANTLPPIGSRGYNLWIGSVKKLKDDGRIAPTRKKDLAALVMALSSKGEWSAPE